MTEPATHVSSTPVTVAAILSNSASSCITQTTQSNGVATINPLLTVNIPAISAMAMQGMNNISKLPVAMCAINSPQRPILPSQTSQPGGPVPASGVSNKSGIIVLNVGAAGSNNLAAALSQIVAGAGLVQQPQVLPNTSSAVQSNNISNNQMATSQTFSTVMSNVGGSSQSLPLMVNQAFSAGGNIQGVNTVSVSQLNYPQAMTIQPNMALNTRQQVIVQGQTQQQTQPQPAAFMLVPIPQMPSVQPGTVNLTSTNVVCSNLNQPEQQQYVVNVPGPMVPYSFQPHHQNASNSSNNLSNPPNIQQPMLCATQQNITTSYHTVQQNSMPKNDELKAFLTKPGSGGEQKVTQSNPTSAVSAVPPQGGSASLSSHPVIIPPKIESSLNLNSVQSMLSHNNSMVSSPGLTFLAQVSTLSSSSSDIVRKSSTNQTTLSTTTDTSVISTLQQAKHAAEVNNNNLISLASEEVQLDSALPTRANTTSIMTVSSTTKLGDESLNEIVDHTAQNASDTPFMNRAECSNFPYTGSATSTTTSAGNQGMERKRKKGPAPKLNGTETCLICGDKSTGYHYNVLSCEGCKGFFRRSVIKGAKYACKGNGDCHIDLYMRRKCQECRFQKCKKVGMKEESVLSEEQVKAKKMKKECDQSSTFNPANLLSDDPSIPKLTPQQRKLVELLNANERRFQWPTTEDMKKVTAWVEDDDSLHSRSLRFAHFTELCILIVQLVVEFTKQLPGFLTVLREDQIVLLKACAIEVMLLRAAKQYNKHDGTINFLNGKLYDKSSFYRAGMQVEFVDPIFQFCKSMAQLDLDETEYAILVAINTFSTDRPHIKDIEKVESMQDPYVELLRVYSKIRHPNDPLMFARILMKIVELRTLNNYHSEQMFALKVQDRKLPPLLAEIWDM